VALSLQISRAQPPSGQLSIPFSTRSPVYDLTGSYTLDQPMGVRGASNDLALLGIVLNNDVHGNLAGSGVVVIDINSGASDFTGNYTANGRISGGAGKLTRVTLSVHVSGEDTVFGVPNTRFNISVQYNLTVDPGTLTLMGTARGEANFAKFGNGRIDSEMVPIPLPANVDGTWMADLNFLALSRISGSAQVVLANGRALQMSLTGSFSTRTDLAKVRLSGINGSQGNMLNLNLSSSGDLQSATGKILGQTVRQ